MSGAGAPDEQALRREEAAIARKYMGRVPWEVVAWGLGNFLFWLSLWPLTFMGVLPLWAAFLLSTVSISICYLPSHEAQHSIIGAKGSRYDLVLNTLYFKGRVPEPTNMAEVESILS